MRTLEQDEKIFRLRLAGLRPFEIAHRLSEERNDGTRMARSTVTRALQRRFAELEKDLAGDREMLRQVEVERLDELIRACWDLATLGRHPPAERYLSRITSTVSKAAAAAKKAARSGEDGDEAAAEVALELAKHAISVAAAQAPKIADRQLKAVDRVTRLIDVQARIAGLTRDEIHELVFVRALIQELEAAAAYAYLERIQAGEDVVVVHGEWRAVHSPEGSNNGDGSYGIPLTRKEADDAEGDQVEDD